MVASGKADIECANTTATQTRMADVDFSSLIFLDGGGFLVKGTTLQKFADFAGKNIRRHRRAPTTESQARRGAEAAARQRQRSREVRTATKGIRDARDRARSTRSRATRSSSSGSRRRRRIRSRSRSSPTTFRSSRWPSRCRAAIPAMRLEVNTRIDAGATSAATSRRSSTSGWERLGRPVGAARRHVPPQRHSATSGDDRDVRRAYNAVRRGVRRAAFARADRPTPRADSRRPTMLKQFFRNVGVALAAAAVPRAVRLRGAGADPSSRS